MIARADDTVYFKMADLMANTELDFSLLAKMCWSKIIMEERDSADQIFCLVQWIRDFCVLTAQSIYLEEWIANGNGLHSRFLFSDEVVDEAPQRVKDSLRVNLQRAFKSNYFHALTEQARWEPTALERSLLRRHAKNGCSREDVVNVGV